jgi:hypothetical protein
MPAAEIDHAQLTDLTDEGMFIKPSATASSSLLVKFEPPLVQLEGIRPRVIQMAKEAEAGMKG